MWGGCIASSAVKCISYIHRIGCSFMAPPPPCQLLLHQLSCFLLAFSYSCSALVGRLLSKKIIAAIRRLYRNTRIQNFSKAALLVVNIYMGLQWFYVAILSLSSEKVARRSCSEAIVQKDDGGSWYGAPVWLL